MLDIKYIAEHPEEIKEGMAKKGYTKEMLDVDALIALYKDIAALKTSSQALSEEKNKLSNSIKTASAEERPAIIAKSKSIGEELKVEQEKLAVEQAKYDDMMLRMPNMPSPESPVGKDDSENVVRRKVGTPRTFDFKPRDHVELMELNDWSELERITKVCGSRTYAIKNELARLELAIHLLVMDKLAAFLIERETITGKEFMKIYREIKGIPEPEETSENKEPDRPGQPQAKPWEQFEQEKRKEQQPVGPEGTAQGQDAGESGRWTPPSPGPEARYQGPVGQFSGAVLQNKDSAGDAKDGGKEEIGIPHPNPCMAQGGKV